MGSYLSEPVTEKVSGDEQNDKLNCGYSSMQGWRVTQEDAHNAILDFDTNTSLFAVYDGHGGHEVAKYSSQKLPEFIKNIEAYKNGDLKEALIDSFLGFDATIAQEEVISVLKEIAGDRECSEESDDVEESVDHLYEEASMPIEQLIEKYKSGVLNPAMESLKKDGDRKPSSPYLKARREGDPKPGGSGHRSAFAQCSTSSKSETSQNDVSSSSSAKVEANGSDNSKADNINTNEVSNSNTHEVTSNAESSEPKNDSNKPIPEIKIDTPDSSGDNSVSDDKNDANKEDPETPHQNGDVQSSEHCKTDNVTSSCSPQENGEVSKKGKGKALTKTKGVKTPQPKPNLRPKTAAQQLYSALLDFEDGSDEDSEDEEDITFEGPPDSDSDDSEVGEKEVEDSEEDDEADEEEDEDDLADIEQEECEEFARNMREEPGSDSGCTAVVALLRGNDLFVANAGDSRCIVCRNGNAVEMSFDHKPEDEPERERVVKAGGKVTADGRVNGGLNLSRAIGDHAYKQHKELSDKEQMITALPDVRKLTINPNEDEFMVLACDGIWNFMSSQEVVEFVRPRLQENSKLSQICEEMFDHCLAPNTLGDGTGCDNMTAIIIQFKSNSLKRPATDEAVEENAKRAKTEETVESTA